MGAKLIASIATAALLATVYLVVRRRRRRRPTIARMLTGKPPCAVRVR